MFKSFGSVFALAFALFLLNLEAIHDNLVYKHLSGQEAEHHCEQIAKLRIETYKKFPYLYAGTLDGEKGYLSIFFKEESAVVLLFDQEAVVGVSTCAPVKKSMQQVQDAFADAGIDADHYLYICDLVVQAEYWHFDLLQQFITLHEEYARSKGYSNLVFLTVEEPTQHPLKPLDYISLEPMEDLGFCLLKGVTAKNIPWARIDTQSVENHQFKVWIKELI